MTVTEHYYLRTRGGCAWTEVPLVQYIEAERAEGFTAPAGQPSTFGFSGNATEGTTGLKSREELKADAREYITHALAAGVEPKEIEQPVGLWAEVRSIFGDRATVFSVAGWGWINQTFTAHREAQGRS